MEDDLITISLEGQDDKIKLITLTKTAISFEYKNIVFYSTKIGESIYSAKFYAFCGEGIGELAEIDINTGKITWTGCEIPDYNDDWSRSLINKTRNEFISFTRGFASGNVTLERVNLTTKERISIEVADVDIYEGLIQHNDKFYTLMYDENIKFVEVNIETGGILPTGIELPESTPTYSYNVRGYSISTDAKKLVVLTTVMGGGHVILKYDLETKDFTRVIIADNKNPVYFDKMICFDNKYYAFCVDEGIKELAEFDINTGKINWTGYVIPNYTYIDRGCVFSPNTNEFVTFGATEAEEDYYINRVNLTTKQVSYVKITDDKPLRRFNNIILTDF